MTIPLINPFVNVVDSAPNVTPFTFRDGHSYLERFEALVKYLNRYLVPWIQENYTELVDDVNAAIAEIENISANMAQYVTDAENAANAANESKDLAATYAADAGNIQDAAIAGHIENVASETYTALTQLFATIDIENIVTSGRLSQSALDAYYTTFFSDDFTILANNVTAVNDRVDDVEADIIAVNTRVDGVLEDVDVLNEELFLKMQALDWRATNPSEWGAPVGQALIIPTHVVPDTKQPAHPSILYFPERWNGYRYWLAYTPYPGNDDDHEDPNLAVSNDGVNWIHAPGVTQPLDNVSGIPYNSDPDLVMGPDNTMHLFWRYYDSSLGANQEKVYVRKSTDGVTWTPKQLVWEYNEASFRPVSPSFIFEDDRWTCYFVDITGGVRTFKRMISTNENPSGGWGAPTTLTITPGISGKEVWHVCVKRIGGGLVGLMNVINPGAGGVGGLLQFITSNDGVTWSGSAETVVPQVYTGQHNNLYRASFVPGYNDGVLGLWVYYSAFQDTPAPNVWNIFRTFLGPYGKGEPITLTAGSGITLTNVDVRKRGGWVYGTFDWSKAVAIAHGDAIAVLPASCTPITNDVCMTTGPIGTAAYPSIIDASNRNIVANNPPASKTSGGVRFKTPILPN